MTQRNVALITGITGQDGSYLAEQLLDKGYTVHGVKRRSSQINTSRIDHLYDNPKFMLHHGDMTDGLSLMSIIRRTEPSEVYNLAAQSHVAVSFEQPEYTANSDALGPLRMLEAIRGLGWKDRCRFYQASTSELYGNVYDQHIQDELTPMNPRSPYGVAKLYGYWITINYREAYGMYACNGILFNHESPRRGETFVTRKITRALAKIAKGGSDPLYLGNIYAKRDWGHARDYCEAMWMMMQQDEPDDYVVATGEQHTVKDFIERACRYIGFQLEWDGEGENEIGYINARPLIYIDPRYYRPAEVDELMGDATLARDQLGWEPKTSFDELIAEMVEADIAR